MTTLPGSVVWLFLLVCLACAQISDIFIKNISNSRLGNVERGDNITVIQRNENTGNATAEIKEPDKHSDEISKTAGIKPQESDENWRDQRRKGATYRTATPPNVSGIPTISPERRNSYLSIAERRKYYNRTRLATTQRPEPADVELEYQETTNKLASAMTETAHTNEIRKKESARAERREETSNQRLTVNSPKNETQAKPQSTRQSVIQSQFQFGQKLNLRKHGSRSQQDADDRSKRKKDKSKVEFTIENSTNKMNRNYPTQSTKLERVDKTLWATTAAPDSDVENFIVDRNKTGKLAEYKSINDSRPEVPPSVPDDNRVTENQTEFSQSSLPLFLDYENKTAEEKESEKLVTHIQDVYNREIFKLENSTAASTKPPGVSSENSDVNVTKSFTSTTESVLVNSTIAPVYETTKAPTFLSPFNNRSGKFSQYGGPTSPVPAPRLPTILKSNVKAVATERVQTTTPMVRVIPKVAIFPTFSKSKPSDKIPRVQPKWKTPAPVESWSSTEEYPLTIELNENNKRILSEMFLTSTPPTEPKKTEKHAPTTRKPSTPEQPKTTTSTTEKPSSTSTTTTATATTMTTTTTTTADVVVQPPEDFPEDHKAQGSQFNTKFYISPNISKSEVIRVMENEDVETDDVPRLTGRSAGIAMYVLGAFGLVPLLLVFVFATKFWIQRQQRQYDCESDAKSEFSGTETQPRQGKKKKGTTDLKKSPSNVTTTTLVTTTRLPRIHHWETTDKQPNKNWEFPRSKLKLKTILGQGNFGQVWKAEAEDMGGHEGVTRLVAVKTVKEGATEKEHGEFKKELEIMQQIGSHPNIVTLLGCCTDQEPYYLIMEYVKFGKLLTYLREHRINENYYNFSSDSDALTSRDLTVFAYCVARGMEYLASRGIIHRDLAARNVLVDHTKLCKIADFGMSRSVRDFEDGQVYEERQHKGALPIRWMAPESLVYSVFTYKSDVWSFGIVMWEIVTLGSTPYPNMGAREVMRRVRDGYRLERPSHCKPEFFRLISHCWAHDPHKRPDFSELRHELGNLLDNPAKEGSYVDLDRFAVNNTFHMPPKTNDLRLLERNDFKSLKRLGNWNTEDWPEDIKKSRVKRVRNNGKGTVTLTGQGSFTVNSRIFEKEFNMI